jgi:DNA repair protein RadA/Sms
MAKVESRYVCQQCAHSERKWLGRCPGCSGWSTFVEERTAKTGAKTAPPRAAGRALPITEVGRDSFARTPLLLGDLDRVLGGGLVPGSLVLLGGEPGVGKSTLLLEVARRLAAAGLRTLYVSAEESTGQTRMRAERLGALHPELFLLAETDLEAILAEVTRIEAQAIILDSVQTVHAPQLEAAPGSVSQVREVTTRMMQLAKQQGITTFLVGHVTKDGGLAGPKTLEHMVDTVLSFESTRGGPHRLLRAQKNRFGSTSELAMFEMRSQGLVPIDNPSAFFLAERPKGRPGSVVTASVEGSRAMLVEVQGLCVTTAFGNPRRTTTGIDPNRVAMLSAVLERKGGLSLLGMDVFVNIAGGATLDDPAADLPVLLALASSLRNRALDDDLLCIGEVGLAGEVRGVTRLESRLEEAARQGFHRVIVPEAGSDGFPLPAGMLLMRVRNLDEALHAALSS